MDSFMVQAYEKKYGKTEVIPITLNGEKLLLIGNREHGGAITTEERFDNFEPAIAHLKEGIILVHGIPVGTIKDIKFRE